jgi:hypothetical protein
MKYIQTYLDGLRAAPWLISLLLLLIFPSFVAAQVLDDFESGPFILGGTVFDHSSQGPLLPIHCIASERIVDMYINGGLSEARLNLNWPDDEVTTVWGDGGGRLEFDYEAPATDLTFGSQSDGMAVHMPVAVAAGSLEIVLMDGSGVQFQVSLPIVGPGTYIYPFTEFTGIDVSNIDFIELNLEVPDFGDYHISDFRAIKTGTSAAAIDVTQDTVEGPPYPTDAVLMTMFFRNPANDMIPIQILEGFLYEVTNDLEPPATQMMAMDSGGGVGMPGRQVAFMVNDLGAEPAGHRSFDLHFHAASVGETMVVYPTIPNFVHPPDPVMPTSFGLGFTTYQNDSDGVGLRQANHWLTFETVAGSGLSFSNHSLMLGDPETHPNSFHVFFDVNTDGKAGRGKRTGPLFEMLLGAEVFDYSATSDVSPRAQSGSPVSNVPNPFNPSTEIRFTLPQAVPVLLTVHDMAGREVRVLAAGEVMAAGPNSVSWDGRDQAGRQSPSGSYLVKLEAGDKRSMRKITLLK